MIKKIFILFLFLTLPFFIKIPSPVIAAATQAEEQKPMSWGEFWTSLWKAISYLFTNLRLEVKLWFSKEAPIPCEPKAKFTDYDVKDQDANSRAQIESVQKYRKGTYLRAITEGRYSDDIIAYFCNGVCTNDKTNDSCMEIRYSTLVYYFYKKTNEKILYDKDDHENPIDYDSAKMDVYNYSLPANSDSYFHNLYDNLSQIPRGAFQNEPNAAGVSSRELNESLRTFIPDINQVATPTASVFNVNGAKAMILDNDLQQKTVYTNFIPDQSLTTELKALIDPKNIPVLGTNTEDENTSTLRQLFRDYLHPFSWQILEGGVPEREWEDCNAEKSHCRGMSQYGALGMALAGKSYEEILKTYYGNVRIVSLKDFAKYTHIQIDISDGTCGEATSLRLPIEEYLRGLGELPSSWGDMGNRILNLTNIFQKEYQGMNALKAQAIAARTYAYVRTLGFTRPICNTAKCQVFRCTIVGKKPNFDIAVKETAYMILVDAKTGIPFNSQYARTFCGPSKIYNSWFMNSEYRSISYDGRNYETDGLVATKHDPNEWCIVK